MNKCIKQKSLIFLLALLCGSSVYSQSLDLGFHSLAGTNNHLPFWLWANQLGRYDQNSSSIQDFELNAAHQYNFGTSDFSIEGKVNLNYLLTDENNFRVTELYGGLNWKFLQLKVGAFTEVEIYEGLSAANGNLAYSRNAKPHPRLRIGLNQFVPLFKNRLAIYGFFEEGLLNDVRYVMDTHLHNKAFYVRWGETSKIQFTVGFQHFVMWAGTHPKFGELQAWEAYIGYVRGSSGNEGALIYDQANILGNGYGAHLLKAHKVYDKLSATLYISHPFDDGSGMLFDNWRDNLYGLFLSNNKDNTLLKGLLIEYYYTKHQGGSYHYKNYADGTRYEGKKWGNGLDNYYNHAIYRSGVTYHQMTMTSPLFAPIIIEDGISMGLENTQFSAIHLAAHGFLNHSLLWKAMATYSNNFGKYQSATTSTYQPTRKQITSLLQLTWNLEKIPLSFNGSLAADYGPLYDQGQSTSRIGSILSIKWLIH